MQNYFSIETEASFRRREWERAAEADARAAQARSTNGRVNWPQIALASLRLLSAPRLPLISSFKPARPSPTGEPRSRAACEMVEPQEASAHLAPGLPLRPVGVGHHA
jgi:hypothetical protein